MDAADTGGRAPLTIEVSAADSEVVFNLSGELDLSNVKSLEEKLEEASLRHPETVVFDLTHLKFLDTSGIGVIVRTSSTVESVLLRNPSDIVRQVVNQMGLAEILSMEP